MESATFPEETLIFAFIRATTVIRALETGEAPIYLGPEPLLSAPCRNPLSANWI